MVNSGVAKKRTLEIKGLVASRPIKLKNNPKNITNAIPITLKKNALLFGIHADLLEDETYTIEDETNKTISS